MSHVIAPPGTQGKRFLALLAALLLVLATAPLAGTADAVPDSYLGEILVTSDDGLVPSARFAGEDRFETAGLIATDDTDFAADFDGDDVVLARSDIFPDALTGSRIGGTFEAPILLTPPDTEADDGALNDDLEAALEEIDPETVYVLGGEEAIDETVTALVAEQFGVDVVRYAGINRFETAALIADQAFDDPAVEVETQTVIVSNGGDQNLVDALVSGAIGAAADAPILLTGGGGPLDPFTADTLEELSADETVTVYVAGGPESLPEDIVEQIEEITGEGTVERVDGERAESLEDDTSTNTRFATAVAFAELGTDVFGFGTDHVNLARGDVFADALALGPHAGLDVGGPAPIVLSATSELSQETEDYFDTLSDCDFESLHVAGGVEAISEQTEDEARAALAASRDACNIELTPESATNLVGETHTVTATVTDNGGNPTDGADVEFTVETTTAGSETVTAMAIPESGTVTTDDGGTADFSFTSLVPETYTITACVTDDAGVERCDTATKTFNTDEFLDSVTVAGVFDHLEALQAIADANGGTRVSGSPGYDASLAYVQELLDDAGYETEVQEFTFDQFTETADPAFEQVAPTATTYAEEEDFATMEYSGSGDATGDVDVIEDVIPGPDGAASAGCEPEEFAGFAAGDVALIQRGGCTFRIKAENAEAAGAVAAVVFNNIPGEVLNGTLSNLAEVTIPVVGISQELGEEFVGTAGLQLRVAVTAEVNEVTTANLLADTPSGDDDNVVMAGAHLDSVLEGPGINDNGSGTAAILETALELAETDVSPRNTVRFAFWGAEESGLIGSNEYVAGLSEAEAEDIALYLNFDMVGSPNFARFVYDGDGDAFGLVGPEGSDAIEERLAGFFDDRGQFNEPTAFDGRSDYLAFINVGIPAGGLFSGAEGIKTDEQAAQYGGEAGVAYDPNYHEVGDTIDNVSRQAVDEFSDNIANATLLYAATTEDVNGDD